MEAQQPWHLSFMTTWILVVLFPSIYSGMETPSIRLESTVFVAFAGNGLNIECELKIPANQSEDTLTCSDPLHTQIYKCSIPATADEPQTLKRSLELKNLKRSGEYSCQYKSAEVYWFLRVRVKTQRMCRKFTPVHVLLHSTSLEAPLKQHQQTENEGYTESLMFDYKEFSIVATFTGVLLVFSVVGSVCVFRGHWKKRSTDCGNTGRKLKNKEESKERNTEEDNVNVITTQSTSPYASLEPGTRSIYDVLDHSTANKESDQSKAKPKKKEPKNTKQTTQPQHEHVFESVYENF